MTPEIKALLLGALKSGIYVACGAAITLGLFDTPGSFTSVHWILIGKVLLGGFIGGEIRYWWNWASK
jgi:hypothetical protein